MKNKLNNILFSNGFNYNRNDQSLYLKLSRSLVRAILNKELTKGFKLPPSRLLAKDLGLSRSTVIKAYDILCLERYISSIQGSGYYINDVHYKNIEYDLKTINQEHVKPQVSKRARHFRKHVNLMNRGGHTGIAFRPGLPPLDIFPVRQWQHLTNNYWKNVTYSEMSYGSVLGLDSLKRNIAEYLRIYRNIQCDHDQVVIVTGSLHSLSLIGDILLDEGDQVVAENPTYANALAVFKSLKAKIVTADIDTEGLSLQSIKNKKLKSPKLVYTIPSNQYPAGVKMSLKRRLELLEWAYKNNCLIVEDDYDHEFSNWENPIASIFGLDQRNSVIYQGTFNKLLHPSIRLGYLIVPPYLIQDIKAMYEQSLRFVSPVTQKVMSEFIERDYLSKHLRQVVQLSSERKDFFVNCFNEYFTGEIELHPVNEGLHLIARLPSYLNDVDFANYLTERKIIAFPYSKYFLKKPKENGLVMGFSSVSQPIIKEKIQKMVKYFHEYLRHNTVTVEKPKAQSGQR